MTIKIGFLLLLGIFSRTDACDSWGYGDDNGPPVWATDCGYTTCASEVRQSPVNLATAAGDFSAEKQFDDLQFTEEWSSVVEGVFYNNGHTVEFEVDQPNGLDMTGGPFGDETFQFLQLHFHWGSTNGVGSEHFINGVQYPLEMHMVHINTKYIGEDGDLDDGYTENDDGVAVLGFVFNVVDGAEEYGPLRNLVDGIKKLEGAPPPAGAPKGEIHHGELPDELDEMKVNLRHFIETVKDGGYYTYDGSLTTPSCTEVVTWLNFKTPIPIAPNQIDVYRHLLDDDENTLVDNFRPTQELGDRTILFSYPIPFISFAQSEKEIKIRKKRDANQDEQVLNQRVSCDGCSCDWTNEYACPWESNEGSNGWAGDDGSEGYKCCCEYRTSKDESCGGTPLVTDFTPRENSWCNPYRDGKTESLSEAKQRCVLDPSCEMFFGQDIFYLCDNGAQIKKSIAGDSTLYIKGGNLQNAGHDCWDSCDSTQGPCDYCGDGMCCRKDWGDTSNGCDGSIGGDGYHACVLPGLINAGKDCWNPCGSTQGPCDYCGAGLCCRKGWSDTSNGCDGTIGGATHVCVLPGGDESETTNTESPSTTGSSLSTDEILSLFNLQNTQLFRDNVAEITLETIEWTQIERCWYYLGECQEDFYLVDYYQDGDKNNNVYKVFVAKEVAIPDSFNTAGYNDQLNLAFFDYEAEGVATMVFVIMPSDWDIFQHRFKTRAINTLAAMAGDALRKQGTKYLITTAVKVGAAMGSVVPGPGTVAGAAIAGTAVKVGLTIYQWKDDIFGEYLRHIG